MEGTVWDNTKWQTQEFIALLVRLVARVQAENVSRAIGATLQTQFIDQVRQIQALLNKDFSVVVMGDFKRGKSTLINALLQQPLVPMDVAPETVTINQIDYGGELSATALFHDGKRVALQLEELAANRLLLRLAPDDDSKQPGWLGRVDRAVLARLLTENFNMVELAHISHDLQIPFDDVAGNTRSLKARELIAYCERRGRFRELVNACYEQRSPKLEELTREMLPASTQYPMLEQLRHTISHVHIQAPVEFLRGIRLVDTPGMNDLLALFDNQVQGYLPQADVVIYVLSVRYPLSRAEREFLKRALQPQDFARIFFVVNRIDEEPPANIERILNVVRKQVNQLFPEALIFELSALDELCRSQGEERPDPARAHALAEAFDRFRTTLRESVILSREMMQLERAMTKLEQALLEFETHISRLRQALVSDQQQLNQTLQLYENRNSTLYQQTSTCQQQLQDGLEALCQQACEWMTAFVKRMETDTVPTIVTVTLAEVQKEFPHFLAETVSSAMNRCLDTQRPFIMNLLHQTQVALHGTIHHASNYLKADAGSSTDGDVVGNDAWLNLDILDDLAEQSVTSIFRFANELLVTIPTYLNSNKQLSASQRLSSYQHELQESLPRLQEAIVIELRLLYHQLATRLFQQTVAVQRQEIAASLATIRQAQELRTIGTARDTTITDVMGELLTTSSNSRQILRQLKAQLSSNAVLDEVADL
jgi:GTPase SAR1 family protein